MYSAQQDSLAGSLNREMATIFNASDMVARPRISRARGARMELPAKGLRDTAKIEQIDGLIVANDVTFPRKAEPSPGNGTLLAPACGPGGERRWRDNTQDWSK